jgi:hypothetical protein
MACRGTLLFFTLYIYIEREREPLGKGGGGILKIRGIMIQSGSLGCCSSIPTGAVAHHPVASQDGSSHVILLCATDITLHS